MLIPQVGPLHFWVGERALYHRLTCARAVFLKLRITEILLRHWNAQIGADLSCELLFDLAMTRDRGGGTVHRIAIHSMSASFTNKETFVQFEVPDEVGSLHKLSKF